MNRRDLVCGVWHVAPGGELTLGPETYAYQATGELVHAPHGVPRLPWLDAPRGAVAIHVDEDRSLDARTIIARVEFVAPGSSTNRFYVTFDPATRQVRMAPDFHVMLFPYTIERRSD